LADVSRETRAGLDLLVVELRRWQAIKNLVGPATLDQVWTRHVADSLQLLSIEHDASRYLDLGSGAGFPGLVLGIALRERAGAQVHLVESNGRKCAFLRHVARITGAPVTVHQSRIEVAMAPFAGGVDVVTARALASMTQLLAWTAPLLTTGARGLFPKGRNVADELTEARESWRFDARLVPSRTDPEGHIVHLRSVSEIQTR
jgi:16S rRNA (guanine527-N7)-methyltransferase